MKVAAVIPHWNRRDLLSTILTNLRGQTRLFDEIIVVDNGSTDDSAELGESLGATILRLESNRGFAAAVNRGIESARSEWVVILNNDVTLQPEWLEILIGAAEREQAWFATGKILRAGDPSTIDGTFDEISRGACSCRCGSGKPDSELWSRPRRIRFAPMTAALFRREIFNRIGLLDEEFGSYMEDVDFGLRCALAGLEGVYVPAARADHRGSATLGAWNPDTVRRLARNQYLVAFKHFRGQALWPMVAGQLLWGILAFRHGKGVAYLRGKISGYRFARRHARDSKYSSVNKDRLRAVIEASESDIFDLGEQAGFDWYWGVYFWLVRR